MVDAMSRLMGCPRCTPRGWRRESNGRLNIEWRTLPGGRVYLGAYCSACGKWLSWLPQSDLWLDRAPTPPLEWETA